MQGANSGQGREGMPTWFAAAGRMPGAELKELARRCAEDPVVQAVLESVQGQLLILNPQRQILAANRQLLKTLQCDGAEELLGQRPGEALRCVNRTSGPGGCGTGRSCMTCGAVISLLASQVKDGPVTGECSLSTDPDGLPGACEYRVRATPLQVAGQRLTIFILNDISGDKRREVLETTFFQDLDHILAGLSDWSDLLLRNHQDAEQIARRIVRLSDQLGAVLENHRLLLQAERGELRPILAPVAVADLFVRLQDETETLSPDEGQRLQLVPPSAPARLYTSPRLLGRILSHMIRNALEATLPTDLVRGWFAVEGGAPCFYIHNPGAMPERVALQVFKRSFSTKAPRGRGLGTYSMKLFGERLLGGEVGFSSSTAAGTCFHVRLPPSALLAPDSAPCDPPA